MKNFNKLISELQKEKIEIKESYFDDQHMGSWHIELNTNPKYRIVHDGRDKTVVLEIFNNSDWECVTYDKSKWGKHILIKYFTSVKNE